jgi:hypothetical protein
MDSAQSYGSRFFSWFKRLDRRDKNWIVAGAVLFLCTGCAGITAAVGVLVSDDESEATATEVISAATSTQDGEASSEDPTATEEEESPTATDVPEPTEAPGPTDTPDATDTPEPTDTPVPTVTATNTPEPTATATPEPTATPVPPVMPIITSGFGDTLTTSVPLTSGLAVFTLSHDGSSNFAIWFHEESTGERLDLLVNEIGPFNGRIAIEIPVDSTYLYDVTANGNWAIEVIQPTPLNWEVIEAPTELSGSGRDVRLFVLLPDGLRRITMNHDGSSNFAIWVYNSDASGRSLIVNEIGAYSGSTGLDVDGDIYAVFDIEADGNWSITVE